MGKSRGIMKMIMTMLFTLLSGDDAQPWQAAARTRCRTSEFVRMLTIDEVESVVIGKWKDSDHAEGRFEETWRQPVKIRIW